MTPLPVYEPWLTDADADAVAAAVRSGWVSSEGPLVAELESAWAAWVGMPHAAAVSSGTLGLELALRALGVGAGDEVLCPAFSIISCARAIVAVGATPVLVDTTPGGYNLDLDAADARVTSRTRAVLAVHTYGYPIAPASLAAFAGRHRLLVVEDAAEAHGAEAWAPGQEAPSRCGSFGDVSVFSFYANKVITAGEGGAVLARSAEVAERVRRLRNLSFDPERRFVHEELGTNARMTSLQAALLLSQLGRIDEIISHKRRVAAAYAERLAAAPAVELPRPAEGTRPVAWMTTMVLSDDAPLDAAELRRRLGALGVGTRPFFVGMHEQPALLKLGLFAGERYPVTERLSRRGLYLPSSPSLTDAQIDRVCAGVTSSLG